MPPILYRSTKVMATKMSRAELQKALAEQQRGN
jgi:hypothetical protein